MSELSIFAFDSAAVRTLSLNGEPWFVATDIAKILGFGVAKDMTRILDDDEKGGHIVPTLGGDQEVTIINESGLYAAILKSRRPEAKAFRKWVTSEVLPAIRKRGSYAAPGAEAAPQFMTGNLSHGADLAVAADRTFRSFMRAARSAGLDLSQALRVANQHTVERTGLDMLAALGVSPDAVAANHSQPDNTPPELLQLAEWAIAAGSGKVQTLAEIFQQAIGLDSESAHGRRLVGRAGDILKRHGFRVFRARLDGRAPVRYWTKR